MIVSSALGTGLLWIGGVAALATVITFILMAAKIIRDGGKADAKREAADANTQDRLAAIEESMRPNGLKNDELGNVVKRSENKLDALASKVDDHIGEERQARKDMWRAIDGKADKRGLV